MADVFQIKADIQIHPLSDCSYYYGMKSSFLTRLNKIAIQGTPQMAVDKEAIRLSIVYSCDSQWPLFYV